MKPLIDNVNTAVYTRLAAPPEAATLRERARGGSAKKNEIGSLLKKTCGKLTESCCQLDNCQGWQLATIMSGVDNNHVAS